MGQIRNRLERSKSSKPRRAKKRQKMDGQVKDNTEQQVQDDLESCIQRPRVSTASTATPTLRRSNASSASSLFRRSSTSSTESFIVRVRKSSIASVQSIVVPLIEPFKPDDSMHDPDNVAGTEATDSLLPQEKSWFPKGELMWEDKLGARYLDTVRGMTWQMHHCDSLSLLLLVLFLPEYLLIPLFFELGMRRHFLAVSIMQIVFVAASGTVQWIIFRDHRRRGSVVTHPKKLQQDRPAEIFGMQLKAIPATFLEFALQVPNYAHTVQTAAVAGNSFTIWSPAMQMEWVESWATPPIIGRIIGSVSLPISLTTMLFVAAFLHGVQAWRSFKLSLLDNAASAANLTFVQMYLGTPAPYGVTETRGIMALFVRLPMLWLKISLVKLTWDCAGWQTRCEHFLAIALAWYSLVPALCVVFANFYALWADTGTRAEVRGNMWYMMLWVVFPLTGLVVVASNGVHLAGIVVCPSHDLSVMNMGCTPVSSAQTAITSC